MQKFLKALEALATGDALGMPTEFMDRESVKRRFGLISTLLDPRVSLVHPNLERGTVTDDTEQNLYLIKTYCDSGVVTAENTADTLVRWMEETRAQEKGYIGPSSLKALKNIENGTSPLEAGRGGTTCGAPMRAPAAALCTVKSSSEVLSRAIYNCSVPTHNTNLAIEAALAVGFATAAAIEGASVREIIKAAIEGASQIESLNVPVYVGASTAWKTKFLIDELRNTEDRDKILDTIYYLNGTGLQANEVAPAALAVFSKAESDVWLAVRLGASLGGDTDTIAALAGLLSALYAGDHNIPKEILERVKRVNGLELSDYANMIVRTRERLT